VNSQSLPGPPTKSRALILMPLMRAGMLKEIEPANRSSSKAGGQPHPFFAYAGPSPGPHRQVRQISYPIDQYPACAASLFAPLIVL